MVSDMTYCDKCEAKMTTLVCGGCHDTLKAELAEARRRVSAESDANELMQYRMEKAERERDEIKCRIEAALEDFPVFDAIEFMDCFEKSTTEQIMQEAYELGVERGGIRSHTRAESLKSELALLRSSIEKYGSHLRGCLCYGEYGILRQDACGCGYTDARSADSKSSSSSFIVPVLPNGEPVSRETIENLLDEAATLPTTDGESASPDDYCGASFSITVPLPVVGSTEVLGECTRPAGHPGPHATVPVIEDASPDGREDEG